MNALASRAPTAAALIQELRAPHKTPLILVSGLVLVVLAGLPGVAGLVAGVVLLATGAEGWDAALVLGGLLAALGVGFPAYFLWLLRQRASHLEWMLGPGASQIRALTIVEVHRQGIVARYRVDVALVGGQTRLVDCATHEQAQAVVRELGTGAPAAAG